MTTKSARNFLDNELFAKRNIVTFRALSRELGIHVNEAKNELQRYHDAVCGTDMQAVPTYLVSGELPELTVSPSRLDDTAMDVDLQFEDERGAVDVVCRSMVLLVDARSLDEAKLQFSRVHSVHIYSLSPSRLGDAGLVCAQSSIVQKADTKGGQSSFLKVGKITGSHVKLRSGVVPRNTASSCKTTLDTSVRAPPKPAVPQRAEQQALKNKMSSEQAPATTKLSRTQSTDKPKPSGKLDWSKAKTKEKEPSESKVREEKKPKLEPESAGAAKAFWTNKKSDPKPAKPFSESDEVMVCDPKGRKLQADTDVESESERSSVAAGPSAVDNDVCSDEDDDGQVRMLGQRRLKRKSIATSDSEMSLRAMMDIDDEQVDRVSRSKFRHKVEGSDVPEEEDNETEKSVTAPPITSEGEESDDMPIVTKKKAGKKPRKVAPVGRNGLKKRRVVKSRTTTDAKGYMQTEDYSSYESVEEEEAVEAKPGARGKGKGAKESAKGDAAAKEGKPKAKAAPKRGGLLHFFGPERGKK